jgi:hypothetical protein
LAPSTSGLSRLKTIIQVIYGLRITTTTASLFRKRTPSTRTSLALAGQDQHGVEPHSSSSIGTIYSKTKQIKSSQKINKNPFH